MMPDCQNCEEKCPQAERAHETAMGRMYATKEFLALVKKIESGQLVEVVRCGECKRFERCEERPDFGFCKLYPLGLSKHETCFCNFGERKENA